MFRIAVTVQRLKWHFKTWLGKRLRKSGVWVVSMSWEWLRLTTIWYNIAHVKKTIYPSQGYPTAPSRKPQESMLVAATTIAHILLHHWHRTAVVCSRLWFLLDHGKKRAFPLEHYLFSFIPTSSHAAPIISSAFYFNKAMPVSTFVPQKCQFQFTHVCK